MTTNLRLVTNCSELLVYQVIFKFVSAYRDEIHVIME